ncbi:MAG: FTR1 family iron permease [Gammaproteobacteria bacterium]|nr:FTR1 family iron permease [Gammaproteobacteria bacterium]
MISNVYQLCCSSLTITWDKTTRTVSLTSAIMLLMLSLTATSAIAATDYPAVMSAVIELGDETSNTYDPAQSLTYGDRFSKLYFGGFEGQGLEFAVGQADQQAMIDIEIGFGVLINSAVNGKSKSAVQDQWQKLREKLVNVPMIENKNASFWSIAIQSLLILLREGVEALLVVAALIAYLRKAGAVDKVPFIWCGVIAALLASIVTAWVLQSIISHSGAAKEALEGATMLLAGILLSYVSFWLFSRREMQQWQGFIHNKLGDAVNGGNLFAIISVAFFAVYREGAETILFYQALVADVDGAMEPIAAGFGIALLLLAVIYFLIFQLSVRLPLKQFFTGTASLLYALSVIFAGKAVLELQIAGWLSSSYLEWLPSIGWLGIFPSIESISLQLIFLVIPVVIYFTYSVKKQAEDERLVAHE